MTDPDGGNGPPTASHASEDQPPAGEQGLVPNGDVWFRRLFYSLLLVWAALLVYWAQGWREADSLFPTIVGVPTVVLTFSWLVYSEFVERRQSSSYEAEEPPDDTDALDDEAGDKAPKELSRAALSSRMERSTPGVRSKRERERYEVVMLGWVLVLPVMLFYLGFSLTIPIYVFGFALFFFRDLKTAVGLSVLTTILVYVLFVVILDTSLWPGELGLFDLFEFVSTTIGHG